MPRPTAILMLLASTMDCAAPPAREAESTVVVLPSPQATARPAELLRWAARRYFEAHQDDVDQLVLWADPRMHLPATEYVAVRNEVEGLGLPVFDDADLHGSQRLRGIVIMGRGWEQVARTGEEAQSPDTALGILAQETAHAWGMKLRYRAQDGRDSALWLGRQGAHWSFLADTGGSPLGGNAWTKIGEDWYRADPPRGIHYTDADLYAMGLLPLSAVGPIRVLTPIGPCPSCEADRAVVPTFLRAKEEWVSAERILAANGPRGVGPSPAAHLRQAWIYLTPAGLAPDPPSLAALRALERAFPEVYRTATRGLGEVTVAASPINAPPDSSPAKDAS